MSNWKWKNNLTHRVSLAIVENENSIEEKCSDWEKSHQNITILNEDLTKKIFDVMSWHFSCSLKVKDKIRDSLRKIFILHDKDSILFPNSKIFIVRFSSVLNRLNWLSEDEVKILALEYIDSDYDKDVVLKNIIWKIKIDFKDAVFLNNFFNSWYKSILLEEYFKFVKTIVKNKLNDDIIKWIAWWFLRGNFNNAKKLILKKIFDDFNEKIPLAEKNKILISWIKNVFSGYFDVDISDSFKIPIYINKINSIINKEVSSILVSYLKKVYWIKLSDDFLEISSELFLSRKDLFLIYNWIVKNFFSSYEEKWSLFEPHLKAFITYFKWTVEIEWSSRFHYPSLKIDYMLSQRWYSYNSVSVLNESKRLLVERKSFLKVKERLDWMSDVNDKDLKNNRVLADSNNKKIIDVNLKINSISTALMRWLSIRRKKVNM